MKQQQKKSNSDIKIEKGEAAEMVYLAEIEGLGSLNEYKQEMILQYLRDVAKGQSIKSGDSLSYTLYGKKNFVKILEVIPNGHEQYLITDRTQFQCRTGIVEKPQIQHQLEYLDEVIDKISQAIEQTIGETANSVLEQGLPLLKGILLTGGSGIGKSSILQFLSKKYSGILISTTKYEGNVKEIQNQLDRVIKNSKLILIDDLFFDQESSMKTILMRLFDSIANQQILIIGSVQSVMNVDGNLRRAGRFEQEIAIELPNHEQRTLILSDQLTKLKLPLDINYLKEIAYQMSGFNVNDIKAMLREYSLQKDKDLKKALLKMNPSGIKDLLAEVPKVEWDQIGGYEEAKNEIIRVIEWPLRYPEQFKKLGISPSKGILLYGPPGCSKTLLARALCTQCNLSFIAVKGPEIFSKYVGDSEKAVRDIFRRARVCAPSVVFFDEIDAIAPQRQGSTDVSDRVLIQLLTEIDGFESLKNVIIIAATNRPASIDKALLRPGRFDHLIFIDIPDESAREAIFKVNLKNMPTENIDIKSLVNKTSGYTGAEITQICREAGLNALSRSIQSEYIEAVDFEVALKKIKASVTFLDREQFISFSKKI